MRHPRDCQCAKGLPPARSGALAGRTERRREDDEGSAIEQHPVAGEAAPDDGRGRLDLFSRGRLGKEDSEVDECVGEKEIEQIAKPGRALGDDFPIILVAGARSALPAQENSGNKNDENAHVKSPKEILGCDAMTEKSADVNPKTENQADEGEKGKESNEGLLPIGKGVDGETAGCGIGSRRSIAKQSFDAGFKEKGAEGLVRVVLHGDGLPREAAEEFIRVLPGSKVAAVFTMIGGAGQVVRIGEDGKLRPRAIRLKGKAEESFGFSERSGVDSACGGGPGFGLLALEPAPERLDPADEKENEPDIKNPRPGTGRPVEGCVEMDKPGCVKIVQCKFLSFMNSDY